MMAIDHAEQSAEVTQQGCTSKVRRQHVLLTVYVLVVGAALSISLYLQLVKPTTVGTSSTKEQQLTVEEDPYSLGCYADDRSSRVMPYVYTNNEMTPMVSSATLCCRKVMLVIELL